MNFSSLTTIFESFLNTIQFFELLSGSSETDPNLIRIKDFGNITNFLQAFLLELFKYSLGKIKTNYSPDISKYK